MTPKNLMLFLAPPAVGALIGFFTNWLAIKMLFRPLEEKRILGVRVPFTPGILPRERGRIAEALGETVASDLLDESTVSGRLRSPEFRTALGKATSDILHELVNAKPAELAAGMDREAAARARDALASLARSFVGGPVFADAITRAIGDTAERMSGCHLDELAGEGFVHGFAGFIRQPAVIEAVSGAAASSLVATLDGMRTKESTAVQIFGRQPLSDFIRPFIHAARGALRSAATAIFADRRIAASMERTGARIIRRAMDRLNVVQRFFMTLGQYDRAILDNMPATIADLAEGMDSILADDAAWAALADRMTDLAVNSLSGGALFEALTGTEADADSLQTRLRVLIASAMANADMERMETGIRNVLASLTIGGLSGTAFVSADRIGTVLASCLAPEEVSVPDICSGTRAIRATIEAVGRSIADMAAGVPLRNTLQADDTALDRLADVLSSALSELAAAESARLLSTIDIRSIVIAKVDSLNMIEVENLILRVVDRELGAITLLGGVLGAVIGLVQSLVLLAR